MAPRLPSAPTPSLGNTNNLLRAECGLANHILSAKLAKDERGKAQLVFPLCPQASAAILAEQLRPLGMVTPQNGETPLSLTLTESYTAAKEALRQLREARATLKATRVTPGSTKSSRHLPHRQPRSGPPGALPKARQRRRQG